MTLSEFIKKLEQTGEWEILNRGFLRLKKKSCCPITAVCRLETGKLFVPNCYSEAAAEIGLSVPLAVQIAFVADHGEEELHDMLEDGDIDNYTYASYSSLRAKLLRACKIPDIQQTE